MVAANKLSEVRILSDATQSLLRGKDSGVAQMADREWYWWLDSQPTEVAEFYRVEVTVAGAEEQREQPLYTLVAFLSADLEFEAESESQSEPEPEPESETEPETGAGDAGK
jgi:general secretion pathway protein I